MAVFLHRWTRSEDDLAAAIPKVEKRAGFVPHLAAAGQ